MKPTSTMEDVARLAGVSAMTVSRALRRDAAVSARTRARVLEVIDEIGYVPDRAAGALSSGRSGLVAAIFPTLALPLFANVAKGLSDTICLSGLELQLASSDYSAEREEDLLRSMLRRRPEAIVLAGVGHTGKTSQLLGAAEIPVVEFLDGSNPPIDSLVGLDFTEISKATMSYLVDSGRKAIALIAPRDGTGRRFADRVGALKNAARSLGVAEPVVFQEGSPASPADQGARGAAAAIASGGKFDAFVFMTDYAAIGGVRAIEAAGLSVPDDIAVFGFGDCEISRFVRPAITTISFNPAGAGVEIGKIVLASLDIETRSRDSVGYRLSLGFELVVRESA